MVRKLAVATLAVLGAPGLAWGQAPPPPSCPPGFEAVKTAVQLDSTGISSWRFLNPQRPFPVVLPRQASTPPEVVNWEACAQNAEISFVNSTSGQGLTVTIPYVYHRFDRAVIGAVAPQLATVVSAMQPARTFAAPKSADELALEVAVTRGIEPQETENGFFELLPSAVRHLDLVVADLDAASAIAKKGETGDDWRASVHQRVQAATDQVKETSALLKQSVDRSTKLRASIANWRKTATSARAMQIADGLTSELVRLEGALADAAGALTGVAKPPPQGECPDLTAERSVCTYRFTLFDNASFKISPDTWVRLIQFSDGLVTFRVTFFDSSIPVSNPEGYLRVRVKPAERKFPWSMAFNGGIGYAVKPFAPRKRPENNEDRPFTLADPFTGRAIDAFNGSARFDLGVSIRDYARLAVSPQFKDGSLGEKDDTRTVTVPQYTVDSFGANGVSLRFGKYSMFRPARGIAINATGEGFQFNFRNISVGHVVKKESVAGVANDLNQDESLTVARISGARGFSIFRRVDAFLLFGEQRSKVNTPYDYTTLGTQMFFADSTAQPQNNKLFSSFSGNVAYFYSDRDAGTFSGSPGLVKVIDGTGHVWLIDAGLTLLRKVSPAPVPVRTFGVLLGAGSGDDLTTPDRDESFVGEQAGFSGYDSLFLSSFAANLKDGTPTTLPIGGGLVNKAYVGVSYTEREYKPINLLWWLARALQLADVASSPATSLRAQAFRLDRPFQDRRDAGWEAGLLWQIEVPAGVTESIGCSRYFPGSATEDFFSATPISCSAQVALSLKWSGGN